ncbi:MAG: PCI domain-containing protein [Candidatus Hodarchaeota archaeon]
MLKEILYIVEKHGYISIEYPFKGVYGELDRDALLDSKIWITPEGISITDKEDRNPMKIFFKDINEFKEIYHPIEQKSYKVINIKYADNDEIHFIFISAFSWQEEIHNNFVEISQNQLENSRIDYFNNNFLEYILPFDDLTFENIAKHYKLSPTYIKNEIKKMLDNKKLKGQLLLDGIIFREPLKEEFKAKFFDYIAPYDEITFKDLSEHFKLDKNYIENEIKKMLANGNLTGRLCSDRIILRELTPKLTAMKCPNCNAPLESKPPCKCDHCGIIVDIMK